MRSAEVRGAFVIYLENEEDVRDYLIGGVEYEQFRLDDEYFDPVIEGPNSFSIKFKNNDTYLITIQKIEE